MDTPLFLNPYVIKYILVGNHGIGKSTLAHMYDKNHYDPYIISTIGIDFVCKDIYLTSNPQQKIKTQVWDTAGTERYLSIVRQYLRNANVAIIMFAIDDRSSWYAVDSWYENIMSTSRTIGYPLIVLVATKSDKMKDAEVTYEEIKKKADGWRCKFYIINNTTSASPNIVHNIFTTAAQDFHDKIIESCDRGLPIPKDIIDEGLSDAEIVSLYKRNMTCCNIL